MSQQLSTKALPQYDWGQEWVKPNRELSCIVIIYKDSDEPDFSDKTLSNGIIVFRNTTTAITEKSFHLKSNQDATTSTSRGGMIRISFKNKRFPTPFH